MKPVQLSFAQMWELYGALKSGIKNDEELLIDAVFDVLDGVSKEQFLQALWLMYPMSIHMI